MLVNNSLTVNSHIIFGFILILGIVGGQLAKLTSVFPRVSGYLFFGLLFGPHVLNIITDQMIVDTKGFTDIAIGIVLFRLGLQINMRYLYSHRDILIASLAECALTFMLVFTALIYLNVRWQYALLAAIISMSSLPILSQIIKNVDTNDSITRHSLTFAAINNLLAFTLFMIFMPVAHVSEHSFSCSVYNIVVKPFYAFIGPFTLSLVMGFLLLILSRLIGKKENMQFALQVAVVVLNIGLARMLSISGMASSLLLGVVICNINTEKEIVNVEPGYVGEIFFIILFVLTGAKLHVSQLITSGGLALAFVAARFIGKLLPLMIYSRHKGLTYKESSILVFTLYPMTGMAISLINITQDLSPDIAAIISSIILASIAIMEVSSPLIASLIVRYFGVDNIAKPLLHA